MNETELETLGAQCFQSAIMEAPVTIKGYCYTRTLLKFEKIIDELEVYEDDVWVTSYPRSGTTWTQEMVWCIANNLDFKAAEEDINTRFPFLDYSFLLNLDENQNYVSDPGYLHNIIELIRNAKRPRFIKTHLPWELLPKHIRTFEKRPKIIHIMRHPKDVCISFYHQSRLLAGFRGDLQQFFTLFSNHKVNGTPYAKNILGFWKQRDEPNVQILRFEDMKMDLGGVIKQVAAFLNVTLKGRQVEQLVAHLSFEAMKNNPAVNQCSFVGFIKANGFCEDTNEEFMRRGVSKSGDSEKGMNAELNVAFDNWIEKEFANTGIVF